MSAILALNASYEPLNTIPLEEAMRLIVQGKAEIVEGDTARPIRSPSVEFPRPLVIRLTRYVRPPRRLTRKVTNTFLFARDKYTCQYCGRHQDELLKREELNKDHVMPQSRGGANTWENCVTSCSTCNSKKANRTPAEAGMKLRSVPKDPGYSMMELRWEVRRLTAIQRKYIPMLYGKDTLEDLERIS